MKLYSDKVISVLYQRGVLFFFVTFLIFTIIRKFVDVRIKMQCLDTKVQLTSDTLHTENLIELHQTFVR